MLNPIQETVPHTIRRLQITERIITFFFFLVNSVKGRNTAEIYTQQHCGWKGKKLPSVADLSVCSCYWRKWEQLLSEPKLSGAKAEIEKKSHHTTHRNLCHGGLTGDRPGQCCGTSEQHRICKTLQDTHLWHTSRRVPTLKGFTCCTCCLAEGAGAVHVWMGDALGLRMVMLL